jgi:alpha-ketoglutaric semialdehyde dehydrogenase
MSVEKVLVAGQWREAKNPSGTFHAVNPANKALLPEAYPVSGMDDINELLQVGRDAALALRTVSHEMIAQFLETCADTIEARSNDLIRTANLETALPAEPRLRMVELPRTTNQLRQASAAVRERSWCKATIDTESNIRTKYGSLGGPVVIFGPNNFPFAFNSISGGDFAAAVAAGNPVIAKANPGHPGTTKILAEAVFTALSASGLPPATVQLIYHTTPELGLLLVSHDTVGAAAFTGSKNAGFKLKQAADKAGKPIYLEMSSINPVLILPGAIRERSEAIAAELFGACALGAGQFCTNPGLIVLQKSETTENFIHILSEQFSLHAPGVLLTANTMENMAESVQKLTSSGAKTIVGGKNITGEGYSYANTLLQVSGDIFLQNPVALQTEVFGTASLIVVAGNQEQITRIAMELEGNLTGSIYSDTKGSDDELYDQIELILRLKVGRLLNDKMPTGVAVVPSMNHGGPFPATGHPGFTAVGIPASMLRFAALHCYDNVRPHRLPLELQDKNPTGSMWRSIDGTWTQRSIMKG